MGGGSYSYDAASTRSYARKAMSSTEIFKNRSINNAMDPYGVRLRESRDSNEHPRSYPIIINLDVTGSMGSIPNYIVKMGLPKIMKKIMEAGIKDPQILFTAIGDHECDSSPLQIGQFESSDELLEHWLENVYLEGGGGGNDGESYLLAWYFAANHTVTDSFEKRKQRGICITIGDEPTLKRVSAGILKGIMGNEQPQEVEADKILEKAEEKWICYHIHVAQTRAGQEKSTQNGWKQLMGSHLVMLEDKENIDQVIADIVIKEYQNLDSPKVTKPETTSTVSTTEVDDIDDNEEILM